MDCFFSTKKFAVLGKMSHRRFMKYSTRYNIILHYAMIFHVAVVDALVQGTLDSPSLFNALSAADVTSTHTHRWTQRQTDTKTDRQNDRKTDRYEDRQTQRQTDRMTERQIDTKTE